MQERPTFSEIQDSLRIRLGAAAWRFRLAAMLAAGCDGLAAGALAGLTLILGGWLGPPPGSAVPPLALGGLALIYRLARPPRRRPPATLWLAAALTAAAAGVLGLTGPAVAWALAGATALAAAAAAWTPDARRLAAGAIDRRLGLAEQLVTAEELLDRPGLGDAERVVVRQACGAFSAAPPAGVDTFWTRGLRAPAGALLAVAALGIGGAIRNAALTASDETAARARIALADRVTADAAALSPREQRELAELARLLRLDDEQAAREKLMELRRLGYRPLKGLPADLLERARLAALAAGEGEERPGRDDGHAADPRAPERRGRGESTSGERVLVYTPAPESAAEDSPTRPVGGYRPLADAWARARAEAADALAAEAGRGWPAEYRTLLRRYFSADP